MDEMVKVIAGLKDGKGHGGDGIPVEVWKQRGDNLFGLLHQLTINAWEVGYVPHSWKDASIVTIYKKGYRTDCGSYRRISHLSSMLFFIFLSAILDEAFRDTRDGVYIQFRKSADIFNVAHFRAKTKTIGILMRAAIRR